MTRTNTTKYTLMLLTHHHHASIPFRNAQYPPCFLPLPRVQGSESRKQVSFLASWKKTYFFLLISVQNKCATSSLKEEEEEGKLAATFFFLHLKSRGRKEKKTTSPTIRFCIVKDKEPWRGISTQGFTLFISKMKTEYMCNPGMSDEKSANPIFHHHTRR